MAKPSYPKDMRERAKADGKHLVTVDVPGMCYQGPVSKEVARELLKFVTDKIFTAKRG